MTSVERTEQKWVEQREKPSHDRMTQAQRQPQPTPWDPKFNPVEFPYTQTFILLHQPGIELSHPGKGKPLDTSSQIPEYMVPLILDHLSELLPAEHILGPQSQCPNLRDHLFHRVDNDELDGHLGWGCPSGQVMSHQRKPCAPGEALATQELGSQLCSCTTSEVGLPRNTPNARTLSGDKATTSTQTGSRPKVG